MLNQIAGLVPPNLFVPVAIGFLCLASMTGSLMRAVFFTAMGLRIARRMIVPAVGIGALTKFIPF